MARATTAVEPPAGLVLRDEVVPPGEERDLLDVFEALEMHEIRMHGQAARRTARHYGLSYDYGAREPRPGEPMPEWLLPLRERCAGLAGLAADDLVEALVQRYPAGATIGWHRDAPAFGVVVGVSLGSACRMRFRRGGAGAREVHEIWLEPRSAYVLAGAARWSWQHSIPPTPAERWSVTFRSLRRPRG